MKIAVIGAGFSGAVIASKLAASNIEVDVYDERPHVAGNCYTARDANTGVLLHTYGPHIFHTNDKEVWDLVSGLVEFKPYVNRVKARFKNSVYSLPVNLHTINQFFNKCFSPQEAAKYLAEICVKIDEPRNFEEQALSMIGEELYKAFFYGYTVKQWGMNPAKLPASILKRLPVRFSYDDNYFSHIFQGMPTDGYTPIIQKMLDSSNINLMLNSKFDKNKVSGYNHIIYSGKLDEWFDYVYGDLGYRTLEFQKETHDGDFQGCAVMNYADSDIPYTRISEHKHFSPWESHAKTVIYKEFSKEALRTDIPYYPIRLAEEKTMLAKYVELANITKNISFVGRLGTYRYLDMDVTIREALDASKIILSSIKHNSPIPAFFVKVL